MRFLSIATGSDSLARKRSLAKAPPQEQLALQLRKRNQRKIEELEAQEAAAKIRPRLHASLRRKSRPSRARASDPRSPSAALKSLKSPTLSRWSKCR